MGDSLFFRKKHTIKVDLGELTNEKAALSEFLGSKLSVNVILKGNKVSVHSEQVSPTELKRLVTKFVYRRSLMNKYWVALEGRNIKICKFKRSKKQQGKKKKGTTPSTITHGW